MGKFKIEIKWAFIYAGMVILWSLAGKAMGFHDRKIGDSFVFNSLVLLPSFVIYILAGLVKRRSLNGIITYKQALLSSFILSGLITVLGIFTTIIFVKIISPEYFPNAITYFTCNKLMTREQATQQFNLQSFIVQGIVGAIISGIIISLITGFIIKRKTSSSR